MENKIKLEILGITFNQIESGVYAVILREIGGDRRIPIIIGAAEAQSIECKLQEIVTPRPLTHDLMVTMMHSFGLSITEVMLRKLPSGIFAAFIELTNGISNETIDSRSSDAIALALRFNAPIYTTEEVMRESGFKTTAHDNGPVTVEERRKSELSTMSMAQLNELLERCVSTEDYEQAAKVKEEMDRRLDPSENK
jgi:hypothetical protein